MINHFIQPRLVSTRMLLGIRQQLDCLLEMTDIISEQLGTPEPLLAASTSISDAIMALTMHLDEGQSQ